MRGEDPSSSVDRLHAAGSPPHARGRREINSFFSDVSGITPACAGKTRFAPLRRGRWKDHPRMRGEDVSYYNAEAFTMGSPPHARGRPPGVSHACCG